MRPWPWIIVALASLLVFPQIADIQRHLPHVDPKMLGHDMAYPAMLTFLPHGMLGVMVAGLLAAYVSTISTHLNWGTSYVVHDFYRRFVTPGATEKHYVMIGRVVTALLMLLAALATLVMETARSSFELMLSIGAGNGLLYLLRWFWWRINAWSEIAAMAGSFVVAVFFMVFRESLSVSGNASLIITVAVTTAIWLAATYLTPPVDPDVLRAFYEKVRPAGPGWAQVRRDAGRLAPADNLQAEFVGMVAGCAFVYSALFGSGQLLLGDPMLGWLFMAVFVASGVTLMRVLPRVWSR